MAYFYTGQWPTSSPAFTLGEDDLSRSFLHLAEAWSDADVNAVEEVAFTTQRSTGSRACS